MLHIESMAAYCMPSATMVQLKAVLAWAAGGGVEAPARGGGTGTPIQHIAFMHEASTSTHMHACLLLHKCRALDSAARRHNYPKSLLQRQQ